MSFEMDMEMALRLLISFGIGTAIGLEREYRSKAAGLRTMIMICLGSTIFTVISINIFGQSHDRIASTIVTGVGFLGAGVIFKDGLSITGITTATTIWISAALGMAVGAGEYFVAIVGSAVVLVVLIVFEKLQFVIERFHQTRVYKITVPLDNSTEQVLQEEMARLNLGFRKRKDLKDRENLILQYEVFGSDKNLERFNEYLKARSNVIAYEY